MGLNTTILIRNDELHEIHDNPTEFVQKLWTAIQGNQTQEEFFRGARVVNCRHADYSALIAVGGNSATNLVSVTGGHSSEEDQIKLLEAFASLKGYTLTPKRKKNGLPKKTDDS